MNNSTGAVTINTDAAILINAAIAANATVGGRLFFKNGIYNINSLTNDATTGCSNFQGSGAQLSYAIGFPANLIPAGVQWYIDGESKQVWAGEYSGNTSVNTSGVVFNITSTAVSSVAAGNILVGFWQLANSTCNSLPANNPSNDNTYKNLVVRFPTNQRGNEIGIGGYFNSDVEYENVTTDFNLPYSTIAAGSAPVVGTYGSFGMTSTGSVQGNFQFFKNTYAVGWNIGYDFQSEHVVSISATSIYCNFPGEFGRSGGAVNYSSEMHQFDDQENTHGFIFGPQMATNSRVDFYGLQIEILTNGQFYGSRGCTGGMTESNPGITSGLIFYLASCTIPNTFPPSNMFTSGGNSFQSFNGATPHFLSQVPGSDTFTRANANNLGAGWLPCFGCSQLSISSNSATTPAVYNLEFFIALNSNPDQFSSAKVNTIDANGLEVDVRGSLTALTYYSYLCTNASRIIRKRVAGTFTTIATAASGGCAVGDTIELDAIGTNLIAYLTHNNVQSIDVIATDSSIATGFPGIGIVNPADSLTNWFGTSLPTSKFANSSLFTPNSIFGIPQKQFVITADYTNATTGFTNVVGVGNAGQGLGFPVAANTSYTMHCSITWSASAATAGPQFQITGPATPTAVTINAVTAVTASTTASAGVTAFATPLNPAGAIVTTGTTEFAQVDMNLINGANAGTIQLQMAAQGAGTLTVKVGSACTLQ